jgi:lysophospholipase L1-like esterase
MVGGNDLQYRSVPEAIAGYPPILSAIPAHVAVVAVGLPPAAPSARKGAPRNADLAALDAGLAAACAARPLCRFVDTAAPMARTRDEKDTLHDEDGVHLSAAGYRIIGDAIAAALPGEP